MKKQKISKAKNPELLKVVNDALKVAKHRQEAEYDGVLGSIPDYLPDPLRREFTGTRNFLLEKHSHEELLSLFRRRRNFLIGGTHREPDIPSQIVPYLDRLIDIEQLVSLGTESGEEGVYKVYLGKDGYKTTEKFVNTQRQKALAKRSRTDSIQRLIDTIVRENYKFSSRDVLQKLKSLKNNRVLGNILEEDREETVIEWQKDDGTPGKDINFSALEKRVSRARKKIKSR